MVYGAQRVLDNLSLTVSAGEIYGLLGANGSGKSTLLRIVAGAIRCSSGQVATTGSSGYVAQKFGLYEDLHVEENLRFFGRCNGLERPALDVAVESVLVKLGLSGERRRRTSELSHGWRQRVKLAVAVTHHPAVLLLDEATAGIDPDGRAEFWNIL